MLRVEILESRENPTPIGPELVDPTAPLTPPTAPPPADTAPPPPATPPAQGGGIDPVPILPPIGP